MWKKDSPETLLGTWLEKQGIKALIGRGNTLSADNATSGKTNYPDQFWFSGTTTKKFAIEWKAFSSPDFFRITKKWQLGISAPQMRQYLKWQHTPKHPMHQMDVYYGLWVGSEPAGQIGREQDGTTYFVSTHDLLGTGSYPNIEPWCHSSKQTDKTEKLGKTEYLFYDLDFIKESARIKLLIPPNENLSKHRHTKLTALDTAEDKYKFVYRETK